MSLPNDNLPNWQKSYRVDRDGRVWSVLTRQQSVGAEHELKPSSAGRGYQYVRLHIDGKKYHLPVHKLVAFTFIGPRPSPKHVLRHRDGDRANNRVENLVWGTTRENFADRDEHGRTSRGVRHSLAIKRGLPEYRHVEPASLAMHYISEALNILRAGGRL